VPIYPPPFAVSPRRRNSLSMGVVSLEAADPAHTVALRPAAAAFDAVAPVFDARFGEWRSVAAQRRAVRRVLLEAFAANGTILELGGGTGEDAAWLASRGFTLHLT